MYTNTAELNVFIATIADNVRKYFESNTPKYNTQCSVMLLPQAAIPAFINMLIKRTKNKVTNRNIVASTERTQRLT